MKQMAVIASCQCLRNSIVHKIRQKAERVFSHSLIFPAKFPNISRFCCHPELLRLNLDPYLLKNINSEPATGSTKNQQVQSSD